MNPVAEMRILDPSRDEAAWQQLIEGLDRRYQDAFLLPGYARAYEGVYGARASLFLFKRGNGLGFHPFLRRPINNLPFFQSSTSGQPLFDIITPEYSGPVILCPEEEKPAFERIFWEEFSESCKKEGIVAEFGRLNPYYNAEPAFLSFIQAKRNRQIVYLDLSSGEKELWAGFSKGNKSSIKKAQKSGITVQRSESAQDIDEFYRLYAQTMKRNQAAEFYYFSQDFFRDLFKQMGKSISLFIATRDGKAVAASIFLHAGDYIHYYFSGSDSDFLELCPNNLLIFTCMEWARKEGYRILSLGGGYHNNGQDSLFKFKSSFSGLRRDFCTYTRIHDKDAYDSLCQKFRSFYKLTQGSDASQGYFPEYRMMV